MFIHALTRNIRVTRNLTQPEEEQMRYIAEYMSGVCYCGAALCILPAAYIPRVMSAVCLCSDGMQEACLVVIGMLFIFTTHSYRVHCVEFENTL